MGFGSVRPALSCLKFIFFRKDLLIVPYTSLDYSSSSSSSFMMLLCLHATDEWVFFASLYQATFVLTSYLWTPQKKNQVATMANTPFSSLYLSLFPRHSLQTPPSPPVWREMQNRRKLASSTKADMLFRTCGPRRGVSTIPIHDTV